MKHVFIVNPIAGGKDATESIRSAAKAAFAGRDDGFEVYVTKAPLDAIDKVRSLGESGEQLRVYACGGDGTFNECVCGAVGFDNVAVAPLPTGTGNDFCRMFGDEKDCFRDIDALIDGWEHPIDVIDCNGRYSVNICSVGIDARIGCNVHKYSKIPLIGGAGGYVISAIVEMFRGIAIPMRITCDGKVYDGKHTLVAVCNGRYYGGGFNPSMTACPDDGELEILIAKDINLVQFAVLIGKYAKGRAGELKKHVDILHSDSVTIEFNEENVVNIDGEAIYTSCADMRIVRNGVRLIVPATMHFFDSKKAVALANA